MYNKRDAEAMRICLDNDIKIVPIPLDSLGTKLRLELHKNGRCVKKSKDNYTVENMTEKITELYHILSRKFIKN